MTEVQGADSILEGKSSSGRSSSNKQWTLSVQPKRIFILYAVKYVNPQHGGVFASGVDKAVINGVSYDKVRHKQYVENDERICNYKESER